MKILKEFISNYPKIPYYLVIALMLGVFLMLFNNLLPRDAEEAPYREQAAEVLPAAVSQESHCEQALEQRLEEALSLVDGVGKVRVVVNFAQGRETIFAVDRSVSTSVTQEQDAQGGTRYQSTQQGQDSTLIITDRGGTNKPLVVTENPPVIGGVMIIAEGGDNVIARDALMRATSTLLGIDINRVHVMKMRER